ncbi:MAG: acylphosphatase [Anaerolineales bacterium]
MNEETRPKKALHVTLYGNVQGVGFRYFTKQNANRLGIVGWVKNQMDGTVEIWAEGGEYKLQKFLGTVREGPSHAHVRNADVEWKEPRGEFSSFRVRY